jgi:hypothetical protein
MAIKNWGFKKVVFIGYIIGSIGDKILDMNHKLLRCINRLQKGSITAVSTVLFPLDYATNKFISPFLYIL